MLFDFLRVTAALAIVALVAPFTIPDVGSAVSEVDAATNQDEVAVLIEGAPTAVLRFEIQDQDGARIPGRLTFVGEQGGIPELFGRTDARPDELAVRKNVVYSLSGKGAITVPVGTWQVITSRGPEWSLDVRVFQFAEGQEYTHDAKLRHEVDTSGYISGDFHLHTLTHSGHGDANLKERVISIVGEGLELGVATDHNHNTDYGTTLSELGASDAFKPLVGNEVTTPIGHFNAFPLDPARPVLDAEATDANALFRLIRGETNEFGIQPILQVNHPRWRDIDYFTLASLDPVTAEAATTNWSADFDTIEVLNENAAWGYHDADVEQAVTTGSSVHWALGDWYNLLNRGMRVFAVGNSDSHTVHHAFAGYPRNYVASSTDEPAAIDPIEIARSIRAGQLFTTTGPFIDFTINGRPSGSTIASAGAELSIEVRVRNASWIQVDRIKVIVNGVKLHEQAPEAIEDPPPQTPWSGMRVRYTPPVDSWIHVVVEGDRPLDPIVSGAERPVLPLAISNPIWIDVNKDDAWTSPWQQAVDLVAANETLRMLRLHGIIKKTDGDVARLILACAQAGRPYTSSLVREALPKPARVLKLSAARAAERTGDPELLPALQTAFALAEDPYLAISMLRAIHACGGAVDAAALAQLVARFGPERVLRYDHELEALLPGEPVSQWRVIGYFGEPGASALLDTPFGPESQARADETHPTRDGGEGAWQPANAREDGYLDLRAIDPDHSDKCVAYANSFLFAPAAGKVLCALGTDDGALLWLNGAQVHRDDASHSAAPMQHLVELELKQGWNELLFKVENAGGPFGLYFRPLVDGMRHSALPE